MTSKLFILGAKQVFHLGFYERALCSSFCLLMRRSSGDGKLSNLMLETEQDHLTDQPTTSTKRIRSSHYILDKSLASSVASVILNNRSNKKSSLLEINPGPGILTKELFSNGAEHVIATSIKDEFFPLLQRNLQSEISSHQLQCFTWDCFSLWRRDSHSTHFDKQYKDTEMEIVASVPLTAHQDDIPVTAFGVLSQVKERLFLRYLVLNFAFLEGIFSVGNIEWFLFVSARIYKIILSSKNQDKSVVSYNPMSVLLCLLFDITRHMEVPGQQFSPPFQNQKRKKAEVVIADQLVKHDMKYLIQFVPKKNWADVVPAVEIFKFSLFLKQLFHKKRIRLIPKMEQLVPGCGLHLISAGYTMIQEVGETSPHQFLQIYNDLQTWPEYQDSGLRFYLMEHAVHGMDDETEGGDSHTEKSSVHGMDDETEGGDSHTEKSSIWED